MRNTMEKRFRIIAVILSMAILVTSLPLSVFAEEIHGNGTVVSENELTDTATAEYRPFSVRFLEI